MSVELVHSLILILTIISSYAISHGPLQQYDLQISTGVFVVYFFMQKILKIKRMILIDAVVATFVVSSIVASTGSISSPFFFLNYFLIFSLSLLLEPMISIVTTITLVIVYLFTTNQSVDFATYLPLFSLPFLTPFASLLGSEYQQIVKKNRQVENSFLFIALVMKNHIKHLSEKLDNFSGDHELSEMKKTVVEMNKAIDEYEKNQ